MMPASRLLKSCAIPPVSWPTASIFWLCRNRSFSSAIRDRLRITTSVMAWRSAAAISSSHSAQGRA